MKFNYKSVLRKAGYSDGEVWGDHTLFRQNKKPTIIIDHIHVIHRFPYMYIQGEKMELIYVGADANYDDVINYLTENKIIE